MYINMSEVNYKELFDKDPIDLSEEERLIKSVIMIGVSRGRSTTDILKDIEFLHNYYGNMRFRNQFDFKFSKTKDKFLGILDLQTKERLRILKEGDDDDNPIKDLLLMKIDLRIIFWIILCGFVYMLVI